ncbi:MAG: hypothetical protein LBR56_00370 [Sporomusaceae bacterium]|jgi:Tfp pilus assembly protein PilV|nr:hypothetical protein [Sporomusaceae bacterium]
MKKYFCAADKQKGYILADALIAVMIFLAALAPLAGIYAWSVKNTADSLHKTTAVFLAQAKLEELKAAWDLNSSLASVLPQDTKKLNGVTFTQEFSEQSYTLNGAKIIWVQVKVAWQGGSEKNNVSLVTYFKD